MSNLTHSFTLSPDPIESGEGVFDTTTGAHIEFLGIVRESEDGQPITGIEYEAYSPMAEKALTALGDGAREKFGPHAVSIHHRTGFVAAGEPSVVIRVATPHSAEAFAISRYYLDRLKTEVPIWKHPVFP